MPRKYPGFVGTRVSAKADALLLHYADARGIKPGELARELIEDGLDRMEQEPTIPLWLEILATETFRTRGVLIRLLEELADKRGWTRHHLDTVVDATRAGADEYGRERLKEIERLRLAAPPHKRR